MDKTFLYYFFSTIAQVFAAILGVVGLFAVFKLENIRQKLDAGVKYYSFRLGDFGIYPEDMPRHAYDQNRQEEERRNYIYEVQWLLEGKEKLLINIEAMKSELRRDKEKLADLIKKEQQVNESSWKQNFRRLEGLIVERERVFAQIGKLISLWSEEKEMLKSIVTPTKLMGAIIFLSILFLLLIPLINVYATLLIIMAMLIMSGVSIKMAVSLVIKWASSRNPEVA